MCVCVCVCVCLWVAGGGQEGLVPEPEDDSAAPPRKRGLRAGIAARAVRRLRGNAEPEAPDGFDWGGTF